MRHRRGRCRARRVRRLAHDGAIPSVLDDAPLHDGGERLAAAYRAGDEWLLALTAWIPDDLLPRNGWVRALVLTLPLSVLLLLLARRGRRRRKIRRRVLREMGASDEKQGRGMYFQLLLLLAAHGFHKRPSETPREFAQRVMDRGGDALLPVGELTELYYEIRFGDKPTLAEKFKRRLQEYGEALKHLAQASAEESDGGTAAIP